MVCTRCVLTVREQLKKIGVEPVEVTLGEIELDNELSKAQFNELENGLKELGFEILDSDRQKQIEKIKSYLIQLVQGGEIPEHFSLSDFIGKKLNKEYSQVSRLFPEVEGITIEQFFILQKIEKVKEWLAYDEWTLSEIAWKLGYSSVAHLSAQFKKVTGLSPSTFKRPGPKNRKSLDKV